jgi:hypothetical protein
MYKKLFGLLVSSSLMAGAVSKSEETQPAVGSYDYDLFRKDKKAIFINAELLYWTVNEGALDYAIKMKHPAWGSPTDAVGHYKVADFDWEPGFRVSLGYFNAPHYWDVYLMYTYYRGRGHDETHQPSQSDLFLNGTWPQPNPNDVTPLKKASSELELRESMVEALATRRFHPNPHLRMRLYGGAGVVWLRQNWEIDYTDINDVSSHLHNQWHFTGAGIRAGLILDWFLGKGGLFFTGLTSVACFAGDYHNVSKQSSHFSGPGFDPSLPLRNAHYHDTRLVPHFQASAGPSWQMAFGNIRTEVFLGYELNIWSNLHEVIRTTSGAPTSSKLTTLDIGMIGQQGVTLRWNLDF